jgi:hypothetical protein
MDNKNWYLIRGEDVGKLRGALLDATLGTVEANELLQGALHTLDTSLHTTDAVPDDYKCKSGKGSGLIGG